MAIGLTALQLFWHFCFGLNFSVWRLLTFSGKRKPINILMILKKKNWFLDLPLPFEASSFYWAMQFCYPIESYKRETIKYICYRKNIIPYLFLFFSFIFFVDFKVISQEILKYLRFFLSFNCSFQISSVKCPPNGAILLAIKFVRYTGEDTSWLCFQFITKHHIQSMCIVTKHLTNTLKPLATWIHGLIHEILPWIVSDSVF